MKTRFLNKKTNKIVEIESCKFVLKNNNEFVHLDNNDKEIRDEDGAPMEPVEEKRTEPYSFIILGGKEEMRKKGAAHAQKRYDKFVNGEDAPKLV